MQILLTNNRADNNVPKNKQAVTETFDKPYKSQWETSDYDDVDVLAKSPDGTNISINFHNFGGDYWHVEFHRNHGQAVTGEGDAQRIFATVLQTIQKFVKKYKPRILEFAASKDVEPGQSSQSRAKLYDRLVQRYARAWGYDLWREDNDDHVVYKFSPLEDVTENFADGLISGKEMLDIFKRMHHEHGYNKQMERWIAKQTWSLDTIEPEQLQDMYNDDEDADPFDRTVWLDDAAVTKYERILSAGHLVNPIIMGLDRTVIDGNHRAQAAKNLHVSIPGYVPVKNDVTENFAADVMSTDDMIAYISAHDGRTLHQDYLDDLNTFSQFVLKTIPLDTIWTELPMLDRAKVEKYKQMDFSKAPPIVIGDGYILDGYHRATVAKALGIKSIKAYVGVKGVTENTADGVFEGPKNFADMKLDNNNIQQELDYYYTGHAPANIGGRKDVGSLKGLDIVTFNNGTNTLMFLVNKDDTAVFYVAYRPFGKGVVIGNVRSNGTVRATEVYAYLVDKFGTLYSDTKQTPQGRKIWDNLAKFYPNLSVTDVGNRLKATNNVNENFADGKHPEDKGDSKRHGIPKHATLTQLDKISHQGGRKGQLAHWQANMRRGRAKTRESIEEGIKKTSLSFPDGDIYIGETHIKDRTEKHGIGLATIEYMLSYAVHYHGDEIAALGPESFVIQKNDGTGIGVAKVLQPDDVTYKYIIATVHPQLRIGRNQHVVRLGRSKHKQQITNEAIAPHGDSWNELNLMKIGQKPAALVGPYEFENLYKPVMRKYNWIWTQVNISNPDPETLVLGFDRYIIGQPGEQARIARMHQLLVQMNKNLSNDIRPDADYHIEMGRLLGYSDADIAEFLKKINL